MTKDQALERLSGRSGVPSEETALILMSALEHGATVQEAAHRLNLTSEDVEQLYPGAIAEAGRLSAFRHPYGSPPATEALPPLFVRALA